MSGNDSLASRIWRATPFSSEKRALVTILDFVGVISAQGGPGQRSLSYAKCRSAIEAAFKPKNLTAVALIINSPGGSPVQSNLILSAIRRAAEEKKTPVYAFIEDIGASGGYMLALAGDEIYADPSSIVGSIGVISAGFGLEEAARKLGVERRVHTAGANKSQLDPFRPEDPKDVARLDTILADIHQVFIETVKSRRGKRLSESAGADEVFSGAFWTAEKALGLGLIDGIQHLDEFIKARHGKDARLKYVPVVRSRSLLRFAGGSSQLPAAAIKAAEDRTLWARYGL